MSTKRRDQGRPATPQSKSDSKSEVPLPAAEGALPTSSAVTQEIAEALGEVLPPGEVSAATKRVLQVIEHRESYKGPIPRPDDFENYERILPGAADRILKMAELEQ